MHHNILTLKWKDRVILFDTGNGYAYRPGAGWLTDQLLEKGITQGMVTDVILTHAHPDHINGLVDASGASVFPQARIHIAQMEYAFWTNQNPDFSKSKNLIEAYMEIYYSIREKLLSLEMQLHFFDKDIPDFPFLRLIPSAGHTPGHTLFHIKAPGIDVLHMADTSHDDQVILGHPEWGTIFDVDFEQAAIERRKVLEELADTGQVVFAYHLPAPGFGHVRKNGDGFEWESIN
jgi:glyoxylase-like metal-dependent hydrolase (beta-lactamase superfamily II)